MADSKLASILLDPMLRSADVSMSISGVDARYLWPSFNGLLTRGTAGVMTRDRMSILRSVFSSPALTCRSELISHISTT